MYGFLNTELSGVGEGEGEAVFSAQPPPFWIMEE